jgi:restriction system protein
LPTPWVNSGDPEAVGGFSGTVLLGCPVLRGLIEGGRATYEAAGRELVLEIDIPDTDIVPADSGWKYIAVRKAVEPTPRRAPDAADIYASLVAQLILAVLDACFRAMAEEIVGP